MAKCVEVPRAWGEEMEARGFIEVGSASRPSSSPPNDSRGQESLKRRETDDFQGQDPSAYSPDKPSILQRKRIAELRDRLRGPLTAQERDVRAQVANPARRSYAGGVSKRRWHTSAVPARYTSGIDPVRLRYTARAAPRHGI